MDSLTFYMFLGEIRTGVWCPNCLLPSAVSFDVYMFSEQGGGYPTPCTTCNQCKS